MAPVQPEASVVQTGLGLRYIQDRVFAYSGSFQASTTVQTVIDTNSGSGTIVGEFQLNAPVATGAPNVGMIAGADIIFNGTLIARIKADGQAENTPASQTQAVVIPPDTTIRVDVDSDDNQAARLGTITFVGRVYGAE